MLTRGRLVPAGGRAGVLWGRPECLPIVLPAMKKCCARASAPRLPAGWHPRVQVCTPWPCAWNPRCAKACKSPHPRSPSSPRAVFLHSLRPSRSRSWWHRLSSLCPTRGGTPRLQDLAAGQGRPAHRALPGEGSPRPFLPLTFPPQRASIRSRSQRRRRYRGGPPRYA